MRIALKSVAAVVACGIMLASAVVSANDLSTPKDVEEAKKHFSFAVQNRNNENFDEATRQFEKSLAFCDTMYQVHYSYANMLYGIDKKELSRTHFRRAYDLNPDHYNTALMLSKVYYEQGVHDSVLVMHEKMYSLKPEKHELLVSIAGLREYLGQDEKALDDYEKIVELGKGTFDLKMRAAKLAVKTSDTARANRFAVLALEEKADDITALKIAAVTSSDLGDVEAATTHYRTLAELEPEIGDVTKLEGFYRTAADQENLVWALEKHHELAPKDVEVIGELSELLYSMGQMEKSIGYVRKGLEAKPGDGRLCILLGEHYRSKNNDEKALEQFKLALNDSRWKSSAQRLIYQIDKPETAEEKKEREFFSRADK